VDDVPCNGDWWRKAVIYQVYPRSFQDSDGDGVGDLRGLITRLDYLNDGTSASLGVDAIWLSPVFPSPMRDFGYDVSDFCAIDPLFGDLATFDELIAECHARGIRVLLDFVMNHTSDQHPWFGDARSSRAAPKRNWYVWRPSAPDGGPPDAMQAVFGGSAWEFDETSGEYYLHSFLREQPDLNWEHPDVVAAMSAVLRFWLERGVDGFRVDAVSKLVKHLGQDSEVAPTVDGPLDASRSLAGTGRVDPRVLEPLHAIRKAVDAFPGRVLIAEAYAPAAQLASLYGDATRAGVHLAFNFQFIRVTSRSPLTPWSAPQLAAVLADAAALPEGALVSYAFSNHDVPRFRSRHDQDGRGALRARSAALVQLGIRGVPCLYYGEEVGMADVPVPADRRVDPAGRDHCRTPMLWDITPGRGFTTSLTPWLPFGGAHAPVAQQAQDDASLLALYRAAIWTRKAEPALCAGTEQVVHVEPDLLAVRRFAPAARPVLVAVNTADRPRLLPLPGECTSLLLASDAEVTVGWHGESRVLQLPPLAAAWLVP
jgi:alpha-glucosidase